MPHTDYIGLAGKERQSFVYRIVSLERLYELFNQRQNVLVSPDKWDDPFENFILKSQRIPRQGWFGQCWTLHRASDAMWRIYSGDKQAVRMRSTPRRLVEGLRQAGGATAFVGRVQYLPEKSLTQFAQRAIQPGYLKLSRNAAGTLLVKRPAFRHESEVRLLVRCDGDRADGLFRYVVDPHSLVDQLMLDPRLSPAEAEQAKREIRCTTAYEGKILRSLLYAPPPPLTINSAV